MKPSHSNSCCSYNKRILFILCIIFPLFISSCITQRDLQYMRDKVKTQDTYNEASFPEYTLRPNDALYIKINSLDDPASNVFMQTENIYTLDPYSAFMTSYTVDKEGKIQLPVIGNIHVMGKTTTQVADMIKDAVVNILSHPIITVKLVNQYVSVLGEVSSPGHFVYSQEKFTIYEAIALAGDINIYGNRKEVILVRNENGKNIRTSIDLTRADILSSPYYFIQPNDFIYVSPLRKRFWGMQQFPFAVIMSTISTALVVYTFIQTQAGE
ncbi:MAG: polysaccharide export protein [Bacteroidales bacterium]|nr:polysaccharide export protein [Bacteroidales bacterium]